MSRYKSYSQLAEVEGQVVAAFVEGFPALLRDDGRAILEKHGISDPRSGTFYLLQSFLDAMDEVAQRMGDQMLFRIGSEIAARAKFPPDVSSLESCLASINAAYHLNHRGGDIGTYTFTDEGLRGGLRRARMTCRNPYPHAFDRGVLEGMAKKFKPSECLDVVVRDDESAPTRKTGADSSTYVITWG
ncbi:MAG: hypothetical protein AB1646_20265 [Thermodesulfobacteriota bacterium]